MPRRRELTRTDIEERLQEVGEAMINASFARDEPGYYELFEERGELRHMLNQLRSMAVELDTEGSDRRRRS